jgi:hypothetical protein
MTAREYVKKEIDSLPETAISQIEEFISFQKYRLGMFEDDADYLASIPGMMESIKEGLDARLPECVPLSAAWPDV